MELKRVVVTGLGALTPLGNDPETFWKNLVRGVSGAAEITRFDPSKFKTQFACEVKNFNVLDHIHRREARRMDLFTQFAVVSSDQALKDAGLIAKGFEGEGEEGNVDPDRAGVVWGCGIGGFQSFMDEAKNFYQGDGTPKFSPFFIPMMIPDIAAGQISIRNGFRGPNYATVSACASSTHALIDSFNLIRLGKADVIVSGGSEAAVTEGAIGGFNALKALSTRNEDPKRASRPFDKTRDGFVLGEGAGAIILESLEHAEARGAKIYCEMVGGGMSADAHHITAPHPDGLGATNVMKVTLEDAGMSPEEVDYVNVHGTSTPLGDIAETQAILKVFGESAYKLSISSTKSMTGHLLGAAGAVEAMACILAIVNGTIPPTINHVHDDEALDPELDFTFNKARKREVNAALSNTFGFGGHNASVLFRKYSK
ncbi:MAG: beta-ketoacyl-ACP synthase II [Bacteroidetes bacterium]|jgi:3-oxoacyl-[acyl-carrier-protein] synthase II|nr:beta-ketoacyl-ACP synthase II [Bacteroidota bacterium]MDA0731727.1 beta-ketoacyl-ACP synthase II [Bacteroidota bacterium]MDA0980300.1 beta-ketoacyl-ACP synthase II [Bacteroidota bacterium]